ncbi:unnamed protein product [Penicillium olsonii]|uniref:Mid2 domain-containing protein n=1 Tax=Penicillium olsonii TaxID=99116 RepID=A0A9W4HXB1_PENOL|nr:unnamed protein product [Penicillium olsonii]
MLKSMLLFVLGFIVLRSNVLTLNFPSAFRITYPQKGDIVNVYNGLPTAWSYNSSDSILFPLLIQFVAASHMEEAPDYITDELNLTLGTYTIQTTFSLADHYLLRFIYGNNAYETGSFDITMSEVPQNASDDTSSSASHLVRSTPSPSALIPPATESATGTASPVQETNSDSGSRAAAATSEIPKIGENNHDGLQTGAKVGIGLGCSAAAVVVISSLSVLYWNKKKKTTIPEGPPSLPSDDPGKIELDGNSATRKIFEMDGKNKAENILELPPHPFLPSELPG